jgi:FlaA1/EpsC-like NDP-sugar epimerase
MVFVLVVRAVLFWVTGIHLGLVRFAGTRDMTYIFAVNLAGSLAFTVVNLITFYLVNGRFYLPFSIIIIEFLSTTMAMVFLRLLAKVTLTEHAGSHRQQAGLIIYGADQAGLVTKNALERDTRVSYRIIGFLDDNPGKANKRIEGSMIFPSAELPRLLAEHKTDLLILATPNLKQERRARAVEAALAAGVKVLNVPPVSQWINGQLSFNQIREISIEDLLGRDTIFLDEQKVVEEIKGKTILITGAAGSIGSQLTHLILQAGCAKALLYDDAETPLFYLELECQERSRPERFETILGDVRSENQLRLVFEKYRPLMVFHAAAYKHVPMMEKNPLEAAKTNIMGTRQLANLSLEFGVEKFIMVSTDKAVNPTNVMGASKRVAEIYTQSLNSLQKTRFITTRFGNVLGSNGSVVSLFKKQIEERKPLTVTHPDIHRYFMTIPEACRLVLEAAAMGKGGEIFVFDMGQPVKIQDLARKMIQLYGLELDRDIKIVYTGLRPGEKLYEELLSDAENTLPTHHPKIMVGKVKTYDPVTVAEALDKMQGTVDKQDRTGLVRLIKQLVPEYQSKHSEFEALDARQDNIR